MLSLSFQTSPNCSCLVSDCWGVGFSPDWTSYSSCLSPHLFLAFCLCPLSSISLPPFFISLSLSLDSLVLCLLLCPVLLHVSLSPPFPVSSCPVTPTPPLSTGAGKEPDITAQLCVGTSNWALEWSRHHNYHLFLSSPLPRAPESPPVSQSPTEQAVLE